MKLETVIYEKQDNIAWIKFNRPEALNAENMQLILDFESALEEVQRDMGVKAVILTGEGRAFCAGADVKEASLPKTDQQTHERFIHISRLQPLVRNLGKPVIAAVRGYALGAGCEFAMMCDIRIASDNARFGFPEASIGAPITSNGCQILPRLVGLGRAKELVLTSEIIDAKEAERIGLANRVVPLEELDKTAYEVAKKIAENNELAVRLMRDMVELSYDMDKETMQRLEANLGELARSKGTAQAGFTQKAKKIGKSKA
jgi:enoyl-CoA hydratase